MIPGQKPLVFEEGLRSAWLYETLRPHVVELVVAGITQSRGSKSDKRDAYTLAEKLRMGNLEKCVFKAPRQFTRLRELSRTHAVLVRAFDRRRIGGRGGRAINVSEGSGRYKAEILLARWATRLRSWLDAVREIPPLPVEP